MTATCQPEATWIATQAEAFVEKVRSDGLPVARLMRDRDGMFTKAFDRALRSRRVKVIPTQFRAPNMSAYAERFVQMIQQECLDHFIVFGTQHMDYLCGQFLEHYHTEWPHQGRENELLVRPKNNGKSRRTFEESRLPTPAEIHCHSRLGGLLKHYYRKAA